MLRTPYPGSKCGAFIIPVRNHLSISLLFILARNNPSFSQKMERLWYIGGITHRKFVFILFVEKYFQELIPRMSTLQSSSNIMQSQKMLRLTMYT